MRQHAGGTPTVFRSAASKIAALGAPFYSFALTQAAIMAASYLVMLLIFILLYGKTIWKDPFFPASLMFFFLFLVFPNIVGGAIATDIRWLVPAYILPFCCAGEPRSHLLHSPFLLVFAFCLCIVNAAVIFSWTVKIDRELDDFDAALSELPAGSRVLPLIFTKDTYPRVTDAVEKVPNCFATNFPPKDESRDDRSSICPQASYRSHGRVHRFMMPPPTHL